MDNELKKLFVRVKKCEKSGGDSRLLQVLDGNTEWQPTTRIAKQEYCLHQLKVIGAQPEKVSHLAEKLETNTVQTGKLDLFDARPSNLAIKIDTIAEKSSGSHQDAVNDQKTFELYEILGVKASIENVIKRSNMREVACNSKRKSRNRTVLTRMALVQSATQSMAYMLHGNIYSGRQDYHLEATISKVGYG